MSLPRLNCLVFCGEINFTSLTFLGYLEISFFLKTYTWLSVVYETGILIIAHNEYVPHSVSYVEFCYFCICFI